MKYRACWIDNESHIQLGELTDLASAKKAADYRAAFGFAAWVENEESEKVYP